MHIVEQMEPYLRNLNSVMVSMIQSPDLTPQHRVYLRIAMLPVRPEHVSYLREDLLTAGPDLFRLVCDALHPFRENITNDLEKLLEVPTSNPPTELRAAVALMEFHGDHGRRNQVERIAAWLVAEPPQDFVGWLSVLERVRPPLITSLERAIAKEPSPAGDLEGQESAAKRQANAAVLLSLLDQDEAVWRLVRRNLDPRVQSHIFLEAAPGVLDAKKVLNKLRNATTEASGTGHCSC